MVKDPLPYPNRRAERKTLVAVFLCVLLLLAYYLVSSECMRRGTLALWADNLGYYHKELRPYRDELSLVARLMPAMVGLLAASTSALVSRRRRGSLLSHAFKVNVLVTGTFSLFAGRATSAWMPCLMVGVLLALIFHVADSPRTGDL